MKKLLANTIQSKFWLLGTFLLLSIIGAFSLFNLPIDAVPDITNVQVMINTKTGALDPEKIEKTVTYPIETELSGVPHIEEIRSISRYGLSQVVVVFEDGTDLNLSRQLISQKLQNIATVMPHGIMPELAPPTTGLGEVLMYTVEAVDGSELSQKPEIDQLLYLRTIQDYTIRPELKKVEGIAEVDSNGGYRKEIHINLDLAKLDRLGLSLSDVAQKIKSLGENYGGGYIQAEGQQIIVRTSGRLSTLDQVGEVPVKLNFRGQAVRIKDFADVREDYTQRVGAATSHGKETVLGTVLMSVGANSRQVALDAEEVLKAIKLPKGVEVKIQYTRSFLVGSTIRTVSKSLIEGAGLVIVVLFLLLGHFRAALIVSLAIPLSLLCAAIGMRFFHISANLMSLGALDFGLLVDGSVVMIENILRRLQEKNGIKLSAKEKLEVVLQSASEVAKPVIVGLLIIMVVYIPVLALEGVEGKMFHPMAKTVLMGLGASLVVAIFLMPVLALIFIRQEHKDHKDPWIFQKILAFYKPTLQFSLNHKNLFLAFTLVFFIGAVFIFTRLGSDFIPQLNEGDVVLGLNRDTSISLTASLDEQKKAEQILLKYPELKNVFARIGTPESATDPMGVNLSDTFLTLEKDTAKWPEYDFPDGRRHRSKDELIEAITSELTQAFPQQEISPTQPIEMRFNEMLEGSRADVSLRIYGPDLKVLLASINKAKESLRDVKGTFEAEMDALTALRMSPMLDVNLDYDAIAKHGASLEDVNRALEMAMGGDKVGLLQEETRPYPIILHLDEAFRNDMNQIRKIPVPLLEGGSVPLSAVADFQKTEQVTTIARSFGKRYAALAIFLKDRDVESYVNEAKAKVESQLKLPEGYTIEWGGQFKNLERARLRILMIIPFTLLVIFLIILRNFNDMKLTFLVYSSIPLAITGGVYALWLRDMPFSISAAVGFIALLGIAILNSMVLVDFITHLEGEGRSPQEAVVEGATMRLRPVLMTALVAGLGFLPMALNTGLGAEVQKPLATVVIGGLVSSTLLTLVLLPSLYLWLKTKVKEA